MGVGGAMRVIERESGGGVELATGYGVCYKRVRGSRLHRMCTLPTNPRGSSGLSGDEPSYQRE